MSKVGNYQIPFDAKGNQQHYPDNVYGPFDPATGRYPVSPPVWRDNGEFADVLTYDSMHSGRSAKYLSFKRQDGTEVTMFIKDFADMMLQTNIYKGTIRGIFTFTKRGQNYGVRYVGPIIYKNVNCTINHPGDSCNIACTDL